ncbi:MAG: phosphoenolpyruvate carboxylase [Gammaproteobacteria bacterium]|nr:phosphoenolpyruvate carboxylase [Gammaproteobacteria bacterium]
MGSLDESATSYDALPARLRSDVRTLGVILGEVIAADRGAKFVSTIEEIRSVAKQARDPSRGSLRELGDLVRSLKDDELVDITRAFNQFLNLANLAEQRYQTKDLQRNFKEEFRSVRSKFGNPFRQMLDQIKIELVLTAHPTEVLRRTLIQKYDELARELDSFEISQDDQKLRELITEAWHTDEIRHHRPSPRDEATWGFAVVENSLWHAVPAIYRFIDDELEAVGEEPLSLEHRIFTFSSWMGGDRDGNPNVTATTSTAVLRLARRAAIDLFLGDVNELIRSLSMGKCNANLRQLVGESTEPYREILRELRDRLEATRDQTATAQISSDPLAIQHAGELIEPLTTCYESLLECNLEVIARGRLLDTIRRAFCFGTNLLTLDIRQAAAQHARFFNALIAHYDQDEEPFESWSEAKKMGFLRRELNSRRPLLPQGWRPDDAVAEVLATFQMIGSEDAAGFGNYVISMASNPSDILQVCLLMKEIAGYQKMPVVPLFETQQDLNRAPQMLEALLDEPWYRRCLESQSNRLQIMIGYSDSAKDAGQFSAAWAQYRAQAELASIAQARGIELTFFHGRGGAIGRGGGPTHEAIMSQPAGSVNGRLRATEQGEMIRFKLGNPKIAFSTLMRYLLSTIEASSLRSDTLVAEDIADIERLASLSRDTYRAQVGSPNFVKTFNDLTPEKELAELAIGSRPNRRKTASDVFALRAIPWVFAWSQVRLMLPAWLGFTAVVDDLLERPARFQALQKVPFFKTQLELLEMMLAKAEPDLTKQYATRLVQGEQRQLADHLMAELKKLQAAFLQLTGKGELLEDEHELRESLQVRNTYVDPLHLLQAELLYRRRIQNDESETINRSLKVTMAGIASGLRNTG